MLDELMAGVNRALASCNEARSSKGERAKPTVKSKPKLTDAAIVKSLKAAFKTIDRSRLGEQAEVRNQAFTAAFGACRQMAEANDGFDEWMKKVDAKVSKRVGMSVHDLPDVPFRDWYEDGKSPKAAATKAIKAAGGGMYEAGGASDRDDDDDENPKLEDLLGNDPLIQDGRFTVRADVMSVVGTVEQGEIHARVGMFEPGEADEVVWTDVTIKFAKGKPSVSIAPPQLDSTRFAKWLRDDVEGVLAALVRRIKQFVQAPAHRRNR